MSLAPVLELRSQFSLTDCIREALADSEHADPHSVADQIIGSLSVDEIEIAFRSALPTLIREQIRVSRNLGRVPGSARWDSVKKAQEDGSLDLMRERIFVGEWKFLGDCTADDCDTVAALRLQEADKLAASAGKYERLGALVRKARVETVSGLPVGAVRKALNV